MIRVSVWKSSDKSYKAILSKFCEREEYTIEKEVRARTHTVSLHVGYSKKWDSLWPPKIRTFWENDPNKSCRDHEGLSLVTLNLTLKVIWRSTLNFLMKILFFDPGFEKGGQFYVQIRCQWLKWPLETIWRSN